MIEDPASMAGGPDGRLDVPGFPGRRRITADSFRMLTARLKSNGTHVSTATAIHIREAAPASVIETSVPEEMFWPAPELPQVTVDEIHAADLEPDTALLAGEAVPDDILLSPFAPLWPLETGPAAPDPVAETEDISGAAPDSSVFASDPPDAPEPFWPLETEQAEPDPVAEAEDISGAAASDPPHVPDPFETPESGLPETQSKPAPARAERVVDAMLQTVMEAIYAKPTDAERDAFLRDIAAASEFSENPGDDGAGLEPPGAIPPEPVPMTVSAIELSPAMQEPEDFPGTLADKLGPSAALLLKQPEAPDPFSKTAKDAILLAAKPVADEASGELALSLLDMMSAGAASGLPQERALAADTLLRMIPRVPVKQLIMVVERVAIMEAPPSLLVAKLIRDPRPDVVAPLLERCMHITDQDLIAAATEGDSIKRRMIARRRVLSTVLADHLIAIGDPSTLLTLIRNPGAGFSHDAFYRLADHASQHHALLAPLATRADLPAPVAFELFWFVPQELRRFIFSRFLTDSETLSKILKITLGAQESGETRFPPREMLESVIDKAAACQIEEAAVILADIGGICQETATRILADPNGEPVTVLLKALGYLRARFPVAMERLQHSGCQLLRPDRNISELESLFDTLSFNKARILLTYWDWFVQKSGPYAAHN